MKRLFIEGDETFINEIFEKCKKELGNKINGIDCFPILAHETEEVEG